MIDITSSKLLILGLVALMVIGPKDLPALLRTIGKYMGIIKRHANDFRAQFEEAMRESELDQIKRDAEASMRDAEAKIRQQLADAQSNVDPSKVLGDPFAEHRTEPKTEPQIDPHSGPMLAPGPDAPAEPLVPAPVTAAPAMPGPSEPAPHVAESLRASEKSGA